MRTPGPWVYDIRKAELIAPEVTMLGYKTGAGVWGPSYGPAPADGQLCAAAPDMLEALLNVRKLISEAAMTGFNCKDGDWPERLFASQAMTSDAIKKATSVPVILRSRNMSTPYVSLSTFVEGPVVIYADRGEWWVSYVVFPYGERDPYSSPSPDNEWLPIATAPRDGTLLLLGFAEVGHTGERYFDIRQGWYESGPADRCWYSIDDEAVRPTHWMSCPVAPIPLASSQHTTGDLK